MFHTSIGDGKEGVAAFLEKRGAELHRAGLRACRRSSSVPVPDPGRPLYGSTRRRTLAIYRDRSAIRTDIASDTGGHTHGTPQEHHWEHALDQHGGGPPPRPGRPPAVGAGILGLGPPAAPAAARAHGCAAVTSGSRSSTCSPRPPAAGEPINGYQVIQQIADRSDGDVAPQPRLGLPDDPAARRTRAWSRPTTSGAARPSG